MCSEVLHVVEREGEPERENTSILIETPSSTQAQHATQTESSNQITPPDPLSHPQQGNWCCSIS